MRAHAEKEGNEDKQPCVTASVENQSTLTDKNEMTPDSSQNRKHAAILANANARLLIKTFHFSVMCCRDLPTSPSSLNHYLF